MYFTHSDAQVYIPAFLGIWIVTLGLCLLSIVLWKFCLNCKVNKNSSRKHKIPSPASICYLRPGKTIYLISKTSELNELDLLFLKCMKKWCMRESAMRACTVFRNVYSPLEARKDLCSLPGPHFRGKKRKQRSQGGRGSYESWNWSHYHNIIRF